MVASWLDVAATVSLTPDLLIAASMVVTRWAIGTFLGAGAKLRPLERAEMRDSFNCLVDKFTNLQLP